MKNTRSIKQSFLPIIGLFAAALLVQAAPQLEGEQLERTVQSFELNRGVVVDPMDRLVYLMRPGGGIDAISTATGNLVWQTSAASVPLAIYGDDLVAQVEKPDSTLEMALLSRQAGESGNLSFNTALPNQVYAFVDDQLGGTFVAQCEFVTNSMYLSWSSTQRTVRGIPTDQPASTTLSQTAEMDFNNGGIRSIEGGVPLDPTLNPPQELTTWRQSNRAQIVPVVIGDNYVTTELRGNNRFQQVILKRWNRTTGQELEDIIIHNGRPILQFASADGKHVLVSVRANPGQFEEYRWHIYSLEDGSSVGTIQDHFSFGWFYVENDQIVFLSHPYTRIENGHRVFTPKMLRAKAFSNSQLIWEHQVRDTRYTGPYPP